MKRGQMADEAAPEKSKAGLGKRLLRIVGVGILCLVALLGGIFVAMGPQHAMALLTGSPAEEAAPVHEADSHAAPQDGHGAAAPEEHAADTGHGPAAPGAIMVTPFKEIIVNISATTATGRETSRFLKLNLALVYDEGQAGSGLIEERKLFLRDSFQEYLRQLNEADIQGSIGLTNLKSELLRRARAISGSDAPQEILIADLIIQ